MLRKLQIRNYAIIHQLDIDFSQGFTIITGETGAGKSIVMGALSLILGERADSKSIMNNADKCSIEGVFDIAILNNVKAFLTDNEFDIDDELIIRREINNAGKSRAFINDTPCTLPILSSLGDLLIDMHRQFDTQELKQNSEQLHFVDEVCNNNALLNKYEIAFKKWKALTHELDIVIAQNRLAKQELDYHQFLFNELEVFQIKENELEEIEQELDLLNSGEALKLSLQSAIFHLKDSEEPTLSTLKNIIHQLEPFASKLPSLLDIKQRLNSVHIELKEISNELEDIADHTNFDEARIQLLSDRLNEGNRLLKKHGQNNGNALIEIRNSLEAKIMNATQADEQEQHLQLSIDKEFDTVSKLAKQLSDARKKRLPPIEEKVNRLLKKVGMPNAAIQIAHQQIDYSLSGTDKIDILFDANRTGKFGTIAKVASGGELSRLMLCIKSLLADSTALPTLIFDEIDTGISGETALQVGSIMKELSTKHQLLCITHLPQIAGKADHHFFIYKEESKQGNIFTRMKLLTNDERVQALAEMVGGKDSSAQTKEMVKELMK